MNTRNAGIISALVAVSLFSAFAVVVPAAIASSLQNHVNNARTISNDETTRAVLQAHYPIAKDGSQGAYGFGILTDKGVNAVMVITTHPGVKDSADQASASDAVWHTHYVKLGQNVSGLCGENPEVVDITFESPGDLGVHGKIAHLRNLPSAFTGTSSLTGDALNINPGTDVQNVVAFSLDPKFDESGGLAAVCVTEITPSEHLGITEIVR